MKHKKYFTFLLASIVLILSCSVTRKPKSFVQVMEPTWSSVEIRSDMGYEEAWEEVVDILAKRFELEMISKDGGYIRTAWIYTWWKQDKVTESYKVRAIVKFGPKNDTVDIKTEALYLKNKEWITGTDTRLLSTLKTDIMGVVGRTTH